MWANKLSYHELALFKCTWIYPSWFLRRPTFYWFLPLPHVRFFVSSISLQLYWARTLDNMMSLRTGKKCHPRLILKVLWNLPYTHKSHMDFRLDVCFHVVTVKFSIDFRIISPWLHSLIFMSPFVLYLSFVLWLLSVRFVVLWQTHGIHQVIESRGFILTRKFEGVRLWVICLLTLTFWTQGIMEMIDTGRQFSHDWGRKRKRKGSRSSSKMCL